MQEQIAVFEAKTNGLVSRASGAEHRATEADERRTTAEKSLSAAEECNTVLFRELEGFKERLTSAEALGPELQSMKERLKTADASAEVGEQERQQLRKAVREQRDEAEKWKGQAKEAVQAAEGAGPQIQHLSDHCAQTAVVKAGML